LLSQTYKNFEIICVNDSSSDNTLSIIEAMSKNDSRIRIIDLKKNEGYSNALNVGLQNSSGEFILFHDPDDLIISKDFFNIAVKKIEDDREIEMVCAKGIVVVNTLNESYEQLAKHEIDDYDIYDEN
jgi:glycosyltransferase involved in cell wall biosynthesis